MWFEIKLIVWWNQMQFESKLIVWWNQMCFESKLIIWCNQMWFEKKMIVWWNQNLIQGSWYTSAWWKKTAKKCGQMSQEDQTWQNSCQTMKHTKPSPGLLQVFLPQKMTVPSVKKPELWQGSRQRKQSFLQPQYSVTGTVLFGSLSWCCFV